MLIRPIIVNYKGADDTIACLSSLAAQEGVDLEPLVLENASGDGSAEKIRSAHPGVGLIESETNTGFAGGNNLAIRHALQGSCDYLFVVNPDTVMEPDCLRQLLACAQANPDAAVVGPAIYWYEDRSVPLFTGSTLDFDAPSMHHLTTDVRKEHNASCREVPWTTGCAMLIRADLFRRIGGFDERFFCYYEDVDWSLRAKRIGLKCLLCPKAILYHKEGNTAKKFRMTTKYYNDRNLLLLMWKHSTGRTRLKFFVYDLLDFWFKERWYLRHGRGTELSEEMRLFRAAHYDFYLRRLGKCKRQL
ncbi:MAG: glycosyltransferase family 2 protein [Cytophagales bacterium]|nr:glycosyltransferase family 2 protein [Armatimonadota bacterium]